MNQIQRATVNHRTELGIAAENGIEETVRKLISIDSANVNGYETVDYWTPLMFASLKGHKDIVKILISNGADVNLCNSSRMTSLMFATKIDNEEIVTILIEAEVDIDAQTVQHFTALLIACDYMYANIIKILIDAGANVNLCDSGGLTALMRVAECDQTGIVRLLIDAGAKVDIQNTKGFTALIFACQYGWVNNVLILIENNANVNLSTIRGKTALIAAAKSIEIEPESSILIIKHLLRAGADITTYDEEGQSFIDYIPVEYLTEIKDFIDLLSNEYYEISIK